MGDNQEALLRQFAEAYHKIGRLDLLIGGKRGKKHGMNGGDDVVATPNRDLANTLTESKNPRPNKRLCTT